MSSSARYVIGIDLGTTNSCLAYTEIESGLAPIVLAIPQVSAAGEVQSLPSLPSFVYLPSPGSVAAKSLDLPWAKNRDFCVGQYALQQGPLQPANVVASSKSWLCSTSAERLADILPADEDAQRRISPVKAASELLSHLAAAWESQVAKGDPELALAKQQLILTIPASFDPVARELTLRAATEAGLSPTLLEEPQAAFYAWLADQGDNWRSLVGPGDSVLVVDIGGGTSDFTLISTEDQEGSLGLRRVAVGDHILLGGDNMDMALAAAVQGKLGKRLNTRQLASLVHSCRAAKESLLVDSAPASIKITIPGSGSSLVGGSLSAELSAEETGKLMLDGFLPLCPLAAEVERTPRSGLRTQGLDYESDPVLSHHLASFLRRSCVQPDGSLKLPAALLFNGGVTKAPALRRRLVELLASWGASKIRILAGADPDLAVARGAAWFACATRGKGVRIKAGSPRSYYVGIESSRPAIPGFPAPLETVCVLPFGAEEGGSHRIPVKGLAVLAGEEVQFRFFASPERSSDAPGDRFEDAEGLNELPPLHATLEHEAAKDGRAAVIPVSLEVNHTEVGTLQIWACDKASSRRWRLEFDLRGQA